MLNIKIIAVGKIKNKSLSDLSEEYLKRLKPFAFVKVNELKVDSLSFDNKERAKRLESERLEKVLKKYPKENIFLLDERGDELDSIRFAKFLNNFQEIVFVIAGSLGFNKELKNKYQKISLSQMTMPHEMARVVLLEQIYRASAIVNGKEYHY